MQLFALFVALPILSSAFPTLNFLKPREQICNGHSEFCDRRYPNVTLIGTHNSAFVGDLLDPRVNQQVSVTEQLNAGIRFLQAQTHTVGDSGIDGLDIDELDLDFLGDDEGSTLEMCHTSCLEYDAGSFKDYLKPIKTWLDENVGEVITLLLVNGDNVNASMFGQIFESSGLADMAFVPSTGQEKLSMDAWPTYSEMIENGTRLIVFLDTGADQASVPYILDEFTYFFETPFDWTGDWDNSSCVLDRPSDGSADGRMYIVNHFLDFDIFDSGVLVPNSAKNYETNAATGDGSITEQTDVCTTMWGKSPNFVLVDIFDRGNVFRAQSMLNGLS